LCCTGHLFIWAKLRPAELDSAEVLGLQVFRSHPRSRGFSQPCPLWQGQCTIYTSPHYPHVCRAYQCKLIKEVIRKEVVLPDALTILQHAKELIHDLERRLPPAASRNFRERLVACLEGASQDELDTEFRQKADALLIFYDAVFGVNDLVEGPDEMQA
jgi:hypothetical protein